VAHHLAEPLRHQTQHIYMYIYIYIYKVSRETCGMRRPATASFLEKARESTIYVSSILCVLAYARPGSDHVPREGLEFALVRIAHRMWREELTHVHQLMPKPPHYLRQYVCVCVYIYTCIHTYICMYTYTYIHTDMHIYI